MYVEVHNEEARNLEKIAIDGNCNLVLCKDCVRGKVEIFVNNSVGYVKWIENNYVEKKFNKAINKIDKNKKIDNVIYDRIAIILESPHKKEFEYVQKKDNDENGAKHSASAIGAAYGTTGQNISKYLCLSIFNYLTRNNQPHIGAFSVSNKTIQNGVYEILLINSIQYQCSLGEGKKQNNKIKRSNFDTIWDNFGKDNFVTRLTDANPSIIINCCTENFKEQVQKAINEYAGKYPNTILLQNAHPASLDFIVNMKRVK